MRAPLGYARAWNLAEALCFLGDFGSVTAVLAGGTDLMIDLRAGDLRASYILDISRLPELKVLELRGEEIHLGAGVTFSEILSSDLLARCAPVLREAASTIGSRQVRNVATIGGNVVHCSPCADSVPALLVHEAQVVLSSREGERVLPLPAFLKGPYRNDRRPEELVTRFVLRAADGRFFQFQKVARRRELATARITLAILAEQGAGGRIGSFRLALGSATPSPLRIEAVEEFLMGKTPTERDLWEAGRLLALEMISISGLRPSTAYKEKAAQGLLVRALYPLVHHEPRP